MWVEMNIIRDEEVKEQNDYIVGWVIRVYTEKAQVDSRTWDEEQTLLK